MNLHEVWLSSRRIFKCLAGEPVFQRARNICCYLSFNNEVHTHGFVSLCQKAGKNILVPKTDKTKGILLAQFTDFSHLSPGLGGIPEPMKNTFPPFDPHEVDLAVIPAVALDRKGNRLGFGAGYYDRFLAQISDKPFLVGVVHDFQLLHSIPICTHDIPVHQVITGRENIKLKIDIRK